MSLGRVSTVWWSVCVRETLSSTHAVPLSARVCAPVGETLLNLTHIFHPVLMSVLLVTVCRYLSYIENRPRKAAPLFAVLRDATGAVLSVSPVINADTCRITQESSNILVEVSGTESLDLVQQVAAEFLERFAAAFKAEHAAAAAGGDGSSPSTSSMLQVAPVRLLTPLTGHVRLIWPKA